MNIKINKIEFTKSGGQKVSTDSGNYYIKKDNTTVFNAVEGKSYDIEFSNQVSKDPKYPDTKWINSIKESVGVENKLSPNIYKSGQNRSFAMSYSKDLVVASKIEVGSMFATADEILEWMDGKEDQLEDTGF